MNSIIDYLQGTAKCDVCGKSTIIYEDRPVTAQALFSAGWRGGAFVDLLTSVGLPADGEASLYCPECFRGKKCFSVCGIEPPNRCGSCTKGEAQRAKKGDL